MPFFFLWPLMEQGQSTTSESKILMLHGGIMWFPLETPVVLHISGKRKNNLAMLTIDTEKSCLRLLNPSPHSQSLIHESQEPADKRFQRHHF